LTHALAGLGFSGREASAAIDTVASDVAPGELPDVPALLRRSIQLLGRTS
jgi:Holliday junction DNA helicase RuvA